ncbi:nitroreductase family protein [Actinomadura barringtoniae]|uniref:Nitroreductase family protein n=1 Tax=Actinomadura barringtoniae TaxID=1427535 RepID=A0A939T1L1_9ACTN|nr:nitroreductase family protein [Actinomadura barringtoniae]MBO2447816.1 nitroreductase family protein [Actinomadura barringtoniae]
MGDAPPFTDLNHVLTTTRAVRLRLDYDRPVPLDVIGECLQLALQAPTGGDAQDWRWVVVADPERKAALADLYLAAYEEHVLAPLNGSAGTEGREVKGRLGGVGADGQVSERTQRILRGADHLARTIGRAPYLVIPCATRPLPERGGPGTSSAVYGSIYPAVWQFNLALRARGLGTVITSLHLHHARRAAEILGIPGTALQVTLLPVAYTQGTEFRPAARRPVNQVAYLDRWERPFPYEDKPIDQLTGEEAL